MVQEIEVKALLTKEKYEELKRTLPAKFRKINDDRVTTIKFKPKDVRVRYSDKLHEVVFKAMDDPTMLSRKEISINLKDIDDCHRMVELLSDLGLEQHPSWTTERADFVCAVEGNEYGLSLQYIPHFAYLLEAEILSDDFDRHIPVLCEMVSSLGCEPLDAADFKARIKEYIERFSKK
jgi:hypothetical protein